MVKGVVWQTLRPPDHPLRPIIFRYFQNTIFLTKMPVIIGERAAAQIELFFVGFGEDIYMDPTPLTTRHVLRFWIVVKGGIQCV